jgi:dipeptidase
MLWINQGRRSLPDPIGGVSWIGLDRPTCNCLMPFYVGVTELPPALQTMNLLEFDRDSAWWAFNFVANYATLKYAYMIQDISAKQKELEEAAYKAMSYFERTAQGKSRSDLTAFCNTNAAKVISEWWALSEALIVKYNDGCITTPDSIMQKVDYPEDWLKDVGYYKGPTSYKKPKGLPGLRKSTST